jgi:adenylate cyclase, class 2
MGRELEAKMQVEDHEPLRARLRAAGAERLSACMELNTFFDSAERTLVAQDKGLRVRHTCDFVTGAERHVVTYKGPQQDGALKNREEVEFVADDGEQAAVLLERLGYAPTLSFEKRRESWRIDDCQVELDELPQLGHFVEIEGPDEEAVLAVRETLELDDRPLVKKSYIAMVDELLKSSGRKTLQFGG